MLNSLGYFLGGFHVFALARFSDPARGIDLGRGEGQRVRGSTGSNRGSTGRIDPVYIQNKKIIFLICKT